MMMRTKAAIIVVALVVRYFVEGVPLQTSVSRCCGKFGQPLSEMCKYRLTQAADMGCYSFPMYNTQQLAYPVHEKRGHKLILLDIPDYVNRRNMLLKKLKNNVVDKNGYFNQLVDNGDA